MQSLNAVLGKKIPDFWEPSTKMLTDPQKFLDSLLQFDKENISSATIEKIEPYIAMESFTPEQVARVSKACTSICMWVRAMHAYYLVCQVVAPKRAQLAEAQALLEATMQQLSMAQSKLKEVPCLFLTTAEDAIPQALGDFMVVDGHRILHL
eukprot:Gb_31252 [translate_table: standard]